MSTIFDDDFFEVANEDMGRDIVNAVRFIRDKKRGKKTELHTKHIDVYNVKAKDTSFQKATLDAITYSDWSDDLRDNPKIQAYRTKYNKYIELTSTSNRYSDKYKNMTSDEYDKLEARWFKEMGKIEKELIDYIYKNHRIKGANIDDVKLFVHNYLDE